MESVKPWCFNCRPKKYAADPTIYAILNSARLHIFSVLDKPVLELGFSVIDHSIDKLIDWLNAAH